MERFVDVAIIGAGTAGLFAAREVKKVTNNFVLIDPGPFGTTCARIACMPSKVLIQAANDFHRRKLLQKQGILGTEKLSIDKKVLLKYVRSMREHYVASVLKSMEKYQENLIREMAFFIDANTLRAGKFLIHAKKIIIATGSSPRMLDNTKELENLFLTSDVLFELDDLPKKMGLIGMGAIGAELGQALSRLGVEVKGFHAEEAVGGISDPVVSREAKRIFSLEYSFITNTKVSVQKANHGLSIMTGTESFEVDMALISIGREPNLKGLRLEQTGAILDSNGKVIFDSTTMQLKDLPIYIAGDADADCTVVPEASDEGRIAGYNSVREKNHCFQRRTRLAITFTSPNIAVVGASFSELQSREISIGEINFNDQGRSVIKQENAGILRVYADKGSGLLLGAEMIAPAGEHLAHLLALAIEKQLTVFDMLKMPFYHPVFEQGLRTALRDLSKKVECKVPDYELAFCDFQEYGIY
jgi:dihydrolipoamide dehydrogenase